MDGTHFSDRFSLFAADVVEDEEDEDGVVDDVDDDDVGDEDDDVGVEDDVDEDVG